jgi:hypothetical protein
VTVEAVCVIGSVEPSFSSPRDGDPGWIVTKKLPSRKMRERIWARASSRSGSASSRSSIVTSAAPSPFGSIFVTLPTSTPAMRTGDFGFRLCTSRNTACSS